MLQNFQIFGIIINDVNINYEIRKLKGEFFMGERVEQVQKMIKSFENAQKRIIRKYNEADIKKEIDDIDSILAQINSDLKRKNLHIERLEEQLKEVSPNERELIEEYKNAIEKSKSFIPNEYKNNSEKLIKIIDEFINNN